MKLGFSPVWPMLAVLAGAWAILVEARLLVRARLHRDAAIVRLLGWLFAGAGVIAWMLIRR